jgi:hypothetical protein
MGLLKRIASKAGVEATPLPTQADLQKQQLEKRLISIWVFLRNELDGRAYDYLTTGDASALEDVVMPDYISHITRQLEPLRQAGVVLGRPSGTRTIVDTHIVDHAAGDIAGVLPEEFTLRETFVEDTALFDLQHQMLRETEGQQRSIQVTIRILSDSEYRLQRVVRLTPHG